MMRALAQSVIEALLFLELSGDEVIDPDSALKAMEAISHQLRGASEAETFALRQALDERILAERSAPTPRQDVLDFCEAFLANHRPDMV